MPRNVETLKPLKPALLKSKQQLHRGQECPRHTTMPLYEYQCKKCGHRFERIQQFSDAPVKKCPECGGKVEQLISAPTVQFKGSGWYVTDYAKKSSGASAPKSESKSESDGKSDSSKDSGSKKDSKPKAESTSKPADKK
jgi:putative FmdB family regulatory protein